MLPITKRPQWCERRMSSPHLSVFRMQQRGVSGYLELWLGVICCWGVRHVVHDITCGGKFSIYLLASDVASKLGWVRARTVSGWSVTARPRSPSLPRSTHTLSLSYALCKRRSDKKSSTLAKRDSLIPVKSDGWTGCVGRVNCFVYTAGQ